MYQVETLYSQTHRKRTLSLEQFQRQFLLITERATNNWKEKKKQKIKIKTSKLQQTTLVHTSQERSMKKVYFSLVRKRNNKKRTGVRF